MTHLPSAGGDIVVTSESSGFRFVGLRVIALSVGESRMLHTGEDELFVLPLQGGLTIEADGTTFTLDGRASVFEAPSDFLYVGRDTDLALHAQGAAVVARPSARCDEQRPARYGPAAEVAIETRGAGPAIRVVRNFGTPQAWPHAERLMCCEVITPPGNWSSYPPHKHDSTAPCIIANEEIYYYRIEGVGGFGLHRTYTSAEHVAAGLDPIDELVEVRDGDVVLVPYGYHGPCVAAPGYPMYYLNVLAGPGQARSMAFCDDPAHAWVRESWG